MPPSPTALLRSWRDGDRDAFDRLLPIVYDELARIAHQVLRSERKSHTLQTRALVHEAYLRLVDADVDVTSQSHFLALAARTMRRVLTDYARRRQTDKRGDQWVRMPLNDDVSPASTLNCVYTIALDDALNKLEAQNERCARVVELHFYGGFTTDETAEVLNVSRNTVSRDLRLARAWLQRELGAIHDDVLALR